VAKKKTKKILKKIKAKTTKKKSVKKTYEHHPDHYNTSEEYLISPLDDDFKEAWYKVREFGQFLGGDQRIYASGRAIMFARKHCYFFVRPKKTYLEVVIFLKEKRSPEFFKAIDPVSKTKFGHTFKLVHPDQVEGELTDAITQAYNDAEPA
jgi:hypothetical protein